MIECMLDNKTTKKPSMDILKYIKYKSYNYFTNKIITHTKI